MSRFTRPSRLSLLVASTILIAFGMLQVGMGPQVDRRKVAQVKSAFVVNFVRYTRWPDRAFTDDDAPITVTVLGHDPLGDALANAARGKKVAGRRIATKGIEIPTRTGESTERQVDMGALLTEIASSHVIFVSEVERSILPELIEALDGKPVLLVSDAPNFCRDGGMLGFILRDNKLAFEANPKRIDAAALKVSSKLLKLATIVNEEGR